MPAYKMTQSLFGRDHVRLLNTETMEVEFEGPKMSAVAYRLVSLETGRTVKDLIDEESELRAAERAR